MQSICPWLCNTHGCPLPSGTSAPQAPASVFRPCSFPVTLQSAWRGSADHQPCALRKLRPGTFLPPCRAALMAALSNAATGILAPACSRTRPAMRGIDNLHGWRVAADRQRTGAFDLRYLPAPCCPSSTRADHRPPSAGGLECCRACNLRVNCRVMRFGTTGNKLDVCAFTASSSVMPLALMVSAMVCASKSPSASFSASW